jgi:Bacterial Ig domain
MLGRTSSVYTTRGIHALTSTRSARPRRTDFRALLGLLAAISLVGLLLPAKALAAPPICDPVDPNCDPPPPITYTLTVATNMGTITSDDGVFSCTSTGSGTCSQDYDEGTTVTLTASSAASGFSPLWSSTPADACSSATPTTCALTVGADTDIGVSWSDVQDPTVQLTGPANNEIVGATFLASATATDNFGIADVRFLIDGNPASFADSSPPYQAWIGGVPHGSHTLTARATDSASRVTTSNPRTIFVDTQGPALSSPSVTAGQVVSGLVPLSITASDTPAGVEYVRFLAAHSAIVAYQEVDADGAPYDASWDTTASDDGAYTVTIEAQDGVGNQSGLARDVEVDNTPPSRPVLRSPTRQFQLTRGISVTWDAASDAHAVVYDVRYRRASSTTTFGAYTTLASGISGRSRTLNGAAGYTYCFSVRARDVVGFNSPWSAQRCTTLPLDDRALAASPTAAWTRLPEGSAYLGTLSGSSTANSYLLRGGLQARRLALLVTRAPGAGTVQVYWNNAALGSPIALGSASTRFQQLVSLPLLPAVQTGTIKIVVVGSKPVTIDGVGVSRV